MPPRRHALRVVALSILLGLLTTVALSWASALFIALPARMATLRAEALSQREWWVLATKSAPGSHRCYSVVMVRAREYRPIEQTTPLPSWADLPVPESRADFLTNPHYEIADARGWPMPALAYRFHGVGRGPARTGDISGGIPLSPRATGAWYDPRALPLTPIWPGLLANTALLALLWLGLLLGPGAVRRAIRRRAGRCPDCGYDLRPTPAATACPECGAPVPAERPLPATRGVP